MDYALEATVDICFRIGQFRNLTDRYLRSLFLHVSASARNNQASPYLIISNNPNPSSITLFEYVSPLFSFSPHAKADLSELAVFRLNIPLQDLDSSPLSCTFTLFQQQFGGVQRVLDEITINHTTLLWINGYCPVFFMDNGCGIDLTVQTQMLKYRVKQIYQAPNVCLSKAVETLFVSYNKLKNRVSSNSTVQCENFGEELTTELAQAMKLSRRKIFESDLKREKGKLIEVAQKYIPEIGDLVMQTWSNYLKELKSKSIEQERKNYLNSLYLMVKENVYHQGHQPLNPEKNELHLDTIKLKTIPITISEVERHDVQVNFSEKLHFVFLVHGYGATTSATRQLELTLRYLYPHLNIVNSIVNEDKTEDSLQNMGKRLASEVQETIKNYKNYSISFIGHSLGGLIVRSALTLLQPLRYSMKNFISLGTPHLGHLFHNSSLNRLGMWTLAKLKKSQVMAALLLETEEGDYRKSYLYELSLLSGLNWFEQVCFYGCSGDKFVSSESALCLNSNQIQAEQRQGNEQACVWQQMRKNINVLLREVGVTKYQVDFSKQNSMSESSLTDDLLGRRDHMNLLCSQTFIECMLASSKNMFQ